MRNTPRLVTMAVLLALIVALGITLFRVVAPFLLPLFLAGMTAVVCQPVYRYFLNRTGQRVPLAAAGTTLAVMAAIMVPLVVGTLIASLQLYAFSQSLLDDETWRQKSLTAVNKAFDDVVNFGNRFLPPEQQRKPEVVADEIQTRMRTTLQELGDKSLGMAAGTTFGLLAGTAGVIVTFLVGLMMYAVALFYFLADGTALLRGAEEMIPMHAEYQRQLLLEFSKVVRSVVLATFLAALGQGLATTLGLWFFGFGHLFVLFILSTLSALIPLAGTWLVWGPCCVILFTNGHPVQATLLAIYGAGFVGFLDNVIRTYVLNSDTKLHPLLAFISVLGGLQVMGLWGVFIGPIVAACLHALVNIFNDELQKLSRERTEVLESAPTPPVVPPTASNVMVPPVSAKAEPATTSHPPPAKSK